MTDAQTRVWLDNHIAEYRYQQRQYRLAVIEDFNVRMEMTESTRKCYVNGKLTVCVPYISVCKQDWDTAIRAVLDTLISVKGLT